MRSDKIKGGARGLRRPHVGFGSDGCGQDAIAEQQPTVARRGSAHHGPTRAMVVNLHARRHACQRPARVEAHKRTLLDRIRRRHLAWAARGLTWSEEWLSEALGRSCCQPGCELRDVASVDGLCVGRAAGAQVHRCDRRGTVGRASGSRIHRSSGVAASLAFVRRIVPRLHFWMLRLVRRILRLRR